MSVPPPPADPLADAAAVISAVGDAIKHFGRPVSFREIKQNRDRARWLAVKALNEEIDGSRITVDLTYSTDRPFRVSDWRMHLGVKHYSFASLENAAAKARLLAADSRHQQGA